MGCASARIQATTQVVDSASVRRLCADGVLSLLTYLNSNDRPLQSYERAIVIDVLAAAGNAFLRALLCAHGSLDIDFMRAFCGLGKNADLVRQHFNESPGDCQEEPAITFSVSDLANF